MGTKIVIGKPPLGKQTHPVMVGKLESGAAVIQTENGWITIEKEHLAGTADALFTVLDDPWRMGWVHNASVNQWRATEVNLKLNSRSRHLR